jgi:hypothetical protein
VDRLDHYVHLHHGDDDKHALLEEMGLGLRLSQRVSLFYDTFSCSLPAAHKP